MIDASDAPAIEVVRPPVGRIFRCALLDFDGTISLIRRGWQEVMTAMEMEVLSGLPLAPPAGPLRELVVEDIAELTGRQTIYQMIRLGGRAEQFGGRPAEPLEYKRRYNDLLLAHIAERRRALAAGEVSAEEMMVPGARRMLELLAQAGLELHLASGTDEPFVVEEARLVGVADFFAGRIHGAHDDYRRHSKAAVIAHIISSGAAGAGLLGFGDGMVEIEETRKAGGYAVGVASDEEARGGRVDEWKRRRLLSAGADVIVPDFARAEEIAALLM